jgi:hypothetical protein
MTVVFESGGEVFMEADLPIAPKEGERWRFFDRAPFCYIVDQVERTVRSDKSVIVTAFLVEFGS